MSAPLNPPMNPAPDVKFGLWAVPESPITIEYSLVIIEEIRHEVAEGYQRLSRGGIEVGGVLYGSYEGNTVRVLGMRPIACEHARGPGFVFSDKDRMALHEQLLRDKQDPHLAGFVSVGWFLSHTRSEILLSESDQEIYSIFFPSPWQVTMVVRPGRGGNMRAGFFVRDAQGSLQCERSYQEFNFPDRLVGPFERSAERLPRADRPERRMAAPHVPFPPVRRPESAEPIAPVRDMAAILNPPIAGPQLLPEKPPRKQWAWLAAWAVVMLVAALFGLRYWMMNSAAEPISLSILERDGQLQIQWNHAARPVVNAVSGKLEIIDGPAEQTVRLSRQDLSSGRFTYTRKSGDVEVRMSVQNSSGAQTQEASRYLGRAPDAPRSSQELANLEQKRAELEAEVQQLRRENGAQAERIQQLERLLRVLQSRLGIDQGKQ